MMEVERTGCRLAMPYPLLADATVAIHVGFVVFVVLGGLLALRWPRLIWVHLPAAAWGVWIEVSGAICPLTPLENWLRQRGGEETYGVTFVERYLLPILYPTSLTREIQWVLAGTVVVINLAVYAFVLKRRTRRRRRVHSDNEPLLGAVSCASSPPAMSDQEIAAVREAASRAVTGTPRRPSRTT